MERRLESLESDCQPIKLLDLPADILVEILEYIRAPTDLKNLCLTCKALNADSTRHLYRKFSLPVELLNDKIVKSLSTQNRGLAYVEIFEMNEYENYCYRQTTHGSYLAHILRSLPHDSLTAIWISTRDGVSPEIDEMVAQTQSKLRNFVSHAAGLPGIVHYTLPHDKLLNITSFTINIESTNDIVRYLSTLTKLPNLANLSIAIMWSFDDGSRLDAAVPPEVIRALLYGSAQSTGITGKVVGLLLEGFDFRDCAEDLVSFLNVNPVRLLAFVDCHDTWRVLKRVAEKPLDLRSFVDQDFDSLEGQDDALSSIDSFLRRCSGLRELKRRYEPDNDAWDSWQGVAWGSIQPHASTLRILDIDDVLTDADSWTAHRSMDAFDKLCTALINLEQLAIRPPNTNQRFWTARDGFMNFLDFLKPLRSLTALKLMVSPESLKDHDFAAEPQPPVPRLTHFEMQELADIIFSVLHGSCPRLTALALYATGNWNAERSRDRLLGQSLGYMRGARADQYGRSSHPVPVYQIKYHEPCSDIFEERIDPNWGTGLV